MLVFAFDRDWTVDVNPHPHHEAVPLEWVRHLAHETGHAVYAIGNQTLAEEAAIPGVVDIVGRHPDEWAQWLGEKQADGRYEQFPQRRERLSLIADLHSGADGYIVVDDLDLSDVNGWDHYHAWDFVPAVKRGEIDPTLPWTREPATDGGHPTTAGIIPADVSDLSSFLKEYADAPAYELTYTDDDGSRTRLLWNVSLDAVRLEQPENTPAIQCTPLEPGAEQFIVDFDAIELLSVVDPAPERYTATAETLAEEATALRRLADAKPDTVRVSAILSLLDRDTTDSTRDRDALHALRCIAVTRPDECTPAIPILRSLLAGEEFAGAPNALTTLRYIGTVDPTDIAPLADDIIPYLSSNIVSARREATKCVALIATEHPEDVVDAVLELAKVIEDDANGKTYAVAALSRISKTAPEAVEPVAKTLGGVVLDDSLDDNVRLNATAALGRVVSESPSVAVDIVDDVVELFDKTNYKLRNNAIGLLYDVAQIHTDVVEPHIDEIAALLVVDDSYTRINASGTISRVAVDFPESVEPLTPMFIRLLSDEDPRVRENACWALGYLRAHEATEPLQETAQSDGNEDVRTRADWALTQIDKRRRSPAEVPGRQTPDGETR